MRTFKIFAGDFTSDCNSAGQLGSVLVGGSCFVFMDSSSLQNQSAVSFLGAKIGS
jgi:hypothetical protein